MSGEFIPNDIAQFILAKIDSVAQLEALMLLRDNPNGNWSAQALAKRLYISEQQTAELLSHLCAQGLVVATGSEPCLYQYQPSSIELRHTVDRVVEIYSKQLVPVTNLIHSKVKIRVQEFANAFKFRKDD
jgi:hypothetical protein